MRNGLASAAAGALIDPAGAVTPVAMQEVFADRLGDVREPVPGGNVGGFPKLDGPRWFVFVPVKSVSPDAGARLEISMTQKGETAGSQAPHGNPHGTQIPEGNRACSGFQGTDRS